MAQHENIFALLGDEDGDDVSKIIERVSQKKEATAMAEKKKKMTKEAEKKKEEAEKKEKSVYKFNRKYMRAGPLSLPYHVSKREVIFKGPKPEPEQQQQPDGQGGDLGTSGTAAITAANGTEQSGKVHPNNGGGDGYQHNNGRGNGYQRNYRGADGYQRNNGEVNGNQVNYRSRGNGYPRNNRGYDHSQGLNGGGNGYRGNYQGAGGYQRRNGGDSAVDLDSEGFQFQGRRGNGRGRGRGHEGAFSENNVSEDNKSQVAVADQQDENQGQNGRYNGGSQQVESQGKGYRIEGQYNERPRSGNRVYDVDKRRYGGENRSFSGQDGRSNGGLSGRKNGRDEGFNYSKRKDHGDVSVTGEGGNLDDEKKKAWEEENKRMTLEEYGKVFLEKRKTLEALNKIEERKVTLDKDFESMQLVGKKNEDAISNNLKSEDKPKKKESLDKEEKVRKSMNINEFLKPAHGRRVFYRQPLPRRVVANTEEQDAMAITEEHKVVANIKDFGEFPHLGGACAIAKNDGQCLV